MSKESSYKKMKSKYEKKIQELNNDILKLVSGGDDSEMTKKKWQLKIQTEKAIWQGEM